MKVLAASTALVCMLAGVVQADPAASPAAATTAASNSGYDTNWVPYQLYRDGKYAQAEAAGVAEKSARGYALAAAAAIGDAALHYPPCMECVQKAENYAKQAIATDPKVPEGHIFYAVALGLDSHIIGTMSALSKGYGDMAKKEIDTALSLSPKNARALGTLGGWNLEVVHGAGSMLASMTYGATADKGIENFNRGLALDPNDVVLHYQYALSMAGLDSDKYHDQIQAQLTAAANQAANSAYEKQSQQRAVELLGLLKTGNQQAFTDTVKKDQGYPP